MLSTARSLLARIRQLLHGSRLSQDFDDELRLHLELEIEHNVGRGMSPADARRAAIASFGGVQRFREETRDARGFAIVESLWRDVRLALRRMRRAPTFTMGVIGTLAIGLGSAAGVGALVYGVMLRPLPYPDPDRLVRVSVVTPGLGISTTENSSGTFVFFQERAQSFSDLGAYFENEGIGITEGEMPERVTGALVTPNVLRIVGAVPAAGRLLNDDDERQDPVPVMIAYDLWQRRFGGDPAIAGKYIELNRSRRRIVGVLPRGFDFPSTRAMVYYPDHVDGTTAGLRYRGLLAIGRLRPGVSVHDAQAELDAMVPHFHERFPELSADAVRQSGLRPIVQTLRAAIIAPVRSELVLLGILVCALLLIATANVATLCLLRADRLRTEVAVSRALGASYAAVARRFIVEGCVLSLLGGVAAIPIVAIGETTKLGFTAEQIPRLHAVELTPGLVFGLLGIALLIGIVVGAVAAAHARSGDAARTLRGETRSGGTSWRQLQRTLVSAQIALALTLLLGAGLMAESLARLRRVDIGFAPAGAMKFTLQLPFNGYPTNQRAAAFHLELVKRLLALPGVTAAATAMQFPLTPQLLEVHPRLEAEREGRSAADVTVNENVASANFFAVMGIPLRSGRTFAPGDLRSATPGIVISTSVARELFGDADPIGRIVRMASRKDRPAYRVVGVCGDVYADRIADGVQHAIYYPLLDEVPADTGKLGIPYVPAGMHFVVRSNQSPATLYPPVLRAVASIDPRVPIWDVRTLDDIVADATARMRLTMLLLAVAAAGTLVLGAVGLYSVIAYSVAGRSGEFAVRIAIGATPVEIIALVLREGALLALVGTAAGVVLSLASASVLRGVLYEVSATDPVVYVVAAGVVLSSSIAAMYLPARRAGNSDPARALRA